MTQTDDSDVLNAFMQKLSIYKMHDETSLVNLTPWPLAIGYEYVEKQCECVLDLFSDIITKPVTRMYIGLPVHPVICRPYCEKIFNFLSMVTDVVIVTKYDLFGLVQFKDHGGIQLIAPDGDPVDTDSNSYGVVMHVLSWLEL